MDLPQDAVDSLGRLTGSWSGTGHWSSPEGESRTFSDSRSITPGQPGVSTLHGQLYWTDSPNRSFYQEVGTISAMPSGEFLLQTVSPNGVMLSIAGRGVASDGGRTQSFVFESEAEPVEAEGTLLEAERGIVTVSYLLEGDELRWELALKVDVYGLADREYRYQSILRPARRNNRG